MKINGIVRCVGFAWLTLLFGTQSGWAAKEQPVPFTDLTREGMAAKMAVDKNMTAHDWNLGPTGARGWMYLKDELTDSSRQILITMVEAGSPADGVLAVGDVILGLDGKLFNQDARIAFGRAIDVAESKKQKGVLPLVVWRNGKPQHVDLKLKVMGSYSETAPYDCAKSAKILDEGCRYIAVKKDYGLFSLGGLVLLASGKEEYKATVQAMTRGEAAFVESGAKSDAVHGSAWDGGYGLLFINEYYLATGDKSVLPYIRAAAINTARGQSMFGTYGHGFSTRMPNGELHGYIAPYGPVNQAGLACFLAMSLAKKAGVEDKELDAALGRSNKFFGYYVGKGTIPYGEHRPVIAVHDDNGKDGSAALAFAIQGRRPEAQFFAKMNVAGYRGREFGHTGPYFGYLWGTPGANVGGPKAAAAYFKQVSWQYDLSRRWDGSFAYGGAGGGTPGGGTRGIAIAPLYLLTYALPLRKLYITGRDPDKDGWLSDKDVAEAIAAGCFDAGTKSVEELMQALGSWSPSVRYAAGEALGKRTEDIVPRLIKMAEGDDANARIGACHALSHLKDRAVPALPVLVRLLSHPGRWLRIQAADALKGIGEAARPMLPELLKAAAVRDESDPLEFGPGALAYTLFYPGGAVAGSPGLLAKSIEGIDRSLLYPAVRAIARNPDSHVRGCLRSTYGLLTLDDVKVMAPDIIESVKDMPPANTMFAKGIRVAGIEVLGKYYIEECLPLCMQVRNGKINLGGSGWGEGPIRAAAEEVLKRYAGAAKSVLPELKKEQAEALAQKNMDQYKQLTDLIAAIENDKNPPRLISPKDR